MSTMAANLQQSKQNTNNKIKEIISNRYSNKIIAPSNRSSSDLTVNGD